MSSHSPARPGTTASARPPRLRPPASARRQLPAHVTPARRTIERPRLVTPLVGCPQRLVLIVAPAGWGKTTLLAEWRRAEPRPFAIVRAADSAALDMALADLRSRPCVLALDGAEELQPDAVRAVVAQLLEQVPKHSAVVIASRRDPGLPLGRRRAEDDVTEVRADRLAMTRSEAADLLRSACPALSPRHADQLFELTAGWPAALRLAARVLRDEGAGAVAAFGGADTVVGEYVREEVLSALSGADRAFLRRASVMPRLTGPACDVALAADDSTARLRRLVDAGVPLAPVDRMGSAYRLNPLLTQALVAELRRVEPALEPALHRRLSAWHEQAREARPAIAHAVQARDADRVSRLLARWSATLVAHGDGHRVAAWVHRIGDEDVETRPALAMAAGIANLALGERDAAEHWAATALHGDIADGSTVRAGALLVRALAGRGGVEQMAADARQAGAVAPPNGPWRAFAGWAEGTAHWLSGSSELAAARLEESARSAAMGAPLVRSLSLAELAFAALERNDPEEAAEHAAPARSVLEHATRDGGALAALTFAVCALVHAQGGRPDAAAADLAQATSRLAALPAPPSWYGAFVRVALARVQLKLSEPSAGRVLLAEAARQHRLVAGAVALQDWIDATWALADDYAAGPVAFPSSLTIAELRVLRLLPSHLTFREIGGRLHVSANTVKTQAHSVYRKLDARSRSEAVAHAAAIGLVDSR